MAAQPEPNWKSKRVQQWDEQDVSEWISSLGGTLKSLQPQFVGFDGNRLLSVSLDSIIDNAMFCRVLTKKLKQIEEKNAKLAMDNNTSLALPSQIMGLVNQGNTCYLNSAIQALLQTPRLTPYFRHNVKAHQHRRNSMLAAWSAICQSAVKNPCGSYTPSLIYKKVINSHASYSFGAQDDAYFALTSIVSQLDDELSTSEHSQAHYMFSTSSVAAQQLSKQEVIEQFEQRQNPMQSNRIRCLMDGIKATKRTCLQCHKYHTTMYESVRTLSLPLSSNAATCDLLLLLDGQQFAFQARRLLSFSSIIVLKYEIQQYLRSQKQINVALDDIEIGHVIKPNKAATNTGQFVEFLQANENWTTLNGTAFAICKPSSNEKTGKNIFVLSVVHNANKEENHRLFYHYQNIPIGNKIAGRLIRQKMMEMAPQLLQIETECKEQDTKLQLVCFLNSDILLESELYDIGSKMNVLINVWVPNVDDHPIICNNIARSKCILSAKIEAGCSAKLVGLLSSDRKLNGERVKVLWFEEAKNRWKCDLLNAPQMRKYVGVKQTNLVATSFTVEVSFATVAVLISKHVKHRNSENEMILRDVRDCLANVHKTEIHDDTSCSLRCKVCNKYSPIVEHEIEVLKAPQILILHLDRAIRDLDKTVASNKPSSSYWFGRRSNHPYKQTHLVNFNLTELQYGGFSYDLFAVCNHHGSSTGYGHYTAFVKTIDHGEWFTANDSSCYQMPENRIVTASALVLLYAKK